MSNRYVYEGGDEAPNLVNLGVLPDGDYKFVVSEFNEPYLKDNGLWVAKVKLTILSDDKQPGGQWVWAHPWSGVTSSGKRRDGIGTFLNCVNRSPKKGQDPDWDDIVNARGQCHLTIEVAKAGVMQGKEVNVVSYFIGPKSLDLAAENRLTMPRKEYVKELEPEKNDEDSIPW